MTAPRKRAVESLSRVEAIALLGRLREILWPDEDPDAEWEGDTIEHVAEVLEAAGLKP